MPEQPSSAPTLADAARFWERRRVVYNVLLTIVTLGWIAFTWPHFRPAFTWLNLGRLMLLALIANALYCAAYAADVVLLAFPSARTRLRQAVWIAGTVFAVVFTNYWIADEIYPYVR